MLIAIRVFMATSAAAGAAGAGSGARSYSLSSGIRTSMAASLRSSATYWAR